MALSSELISQFVKATKDSKPTKSETTVYGTVVEKDDGSTYVQLDGSDILTPVTTTATYKNGERVSVMIKNHTAIVTGNITSPSASSADVEIIRKESGEAIDQITEFEIIVSNIVTTSEFYAEVARIDSLVAEDVKIKDQLTAAEADIDSLQATQLTVTNSLTAAEADIQKLYSEKVSADFIEGTYATIESLEAVSADFNALEATYADFSVATVTRLNAIEATLDSLEVGDFSAQYAKIDFSNIGKAAMEYLYSTSGLIENVIIDNGSITGTLIGVTIKGDILEAGTVVADKLVIQGEDGLYYKLNTDGVTTEAEQTEYNSLNGSIITAKSITATQISVEDLVAFGATIGGFNITTDAIFSGVKESVTNSTNGTYLDNIGQFSLGDANNYIRYYKDENDIWRLEISAESILFGSDSKSSADDIRALTEHVKIGTYVDPDTGDILPSVELSEGDSSFKQIITNTSTMFTDGSVVKTKIDTDGITTTNVTVKDEFRHGGFVWKTRSNGNLGLMWKGGEIINGYNN